MKRLIIVILALITFNVISAKSSFGQNTKYVGGSIEITENGATSMLGKNVSVTYDNYFKSYIITYLDINGVKDKIIFKYVNDSNYSFNGNIFDCSFCEQGLSYSKNGKGFIVFSDLRMINKGGSGITFSIKGLTFKK